MQVQLPSLQLPALQLPELQLPELPLQGGCQCGRVRYRVTTHPLTFYLCHCRECQRHTSSAFVESLRIHRTALEVSGVLRQVVRVADSGAVRQGWFCPDCGVRIWHGANTSEEINLKAGTLDDPSWLMPAGHLWTRSARSFVSLDQTTLCYPGQPEDNYAALKARWRDMSTPHGPHGPQGPQIDAVIQEPRPRSPVS